MNIISIEEFIKRINDKNILLIHLVNYLIKIFNFVIISDLLKNDVRTLNMINKYKDKITINSKIHSYNTEKYTEHNYIILEKHDIIDNKIIYEYFASNNI